MRSGESAPPAGPAETALFAAVVVVLQLFLALLRLLVIPIRPRSVPALDRVSVLRKPEKRNIQQHMEWSLIGDQNIAMIMIGDSLSRSDLVAPPAPLTEAEQCGNLADTTVVQQRKFRSCYPEDGYGHLLVHKLCTRPATSTTCTDSPAWDR